VEPAGGAASSKDAMTPSLARSLFAAPAVALLLAGCASEPEAPRPSETSASTAAELTCLKLRRGNTGNIADATLRSDPASPNVASANFGLSQAVDVGVLGTSTRVGVLTFDLSPIPTSATIAYASLSLKKTQGLGGGTLELHRITTPWTETTVTWNGLLGAIDPTVQGTIPLASVPNGGVATVDVTALVQSWVAGAVPNDGMALELPGGARATFGASDATVLAVRPFLDVCYAPPTCQNGVQDGTETGLDCGGACAPCANLCAAVVCAPLSACHTAGVCNPVTGLCSNPPAPFGTACDDADACTQVDTCQNGACVGASAVTCSALDACHDVGACDPQTGLCSNPPATDGTGCDDGDPCTTADTCLSGLCGGTAGGCQSCVDGTQNQDETGIDCGGSVCGPCASVFAGFPVAPSEYVEFALNTSASTSTWDLTGNFTAGLTNTMTWTAGEKAWTAAGSSSSYIDTAWRPSGGAKTACMWKKWYDPATLSGQYGLDGYQIAGNYFYYGSIASAWYSYSGSVGGVADNMGTSPAGPTNGAWVFYCLSSGGANATTQYYSALPADGTPVLRHHQSNNGGDVGHASDASGMRYGVLTPTNQHPSKAHYGSFMHFDAQLTSAQIAQVYQATRIYYPDHGGVRDASACGAGACGSCADGLLNQDEAGVDCGGTVCGPCSGAVGGMSAQPVQYMEFALTPTSATSTWDLTGNYTSGIVNTMSWEPAEMAWKASASASTYIDTAWKPGGGAKTACMWKKWYDPATLSGGYGIDGYQVPGNYFYYGSYGGTFYFYSGSAGGNATNQGNPTTGPAVGAWVFYCLSSGGSGGSSQFYAAAPADGAPVLRHNQAANGGDPGHAGDSSGMRYGVLWPTANHPSSAYYGSMIHFDAQLSAAQITEVYQATRVHYPDHGGARTGACGAGSCGTCSDGAQNQDETGVDCGGTFCLPCPAAIPGMPVQPAQYIEFALNQTSVTGTWDLTGNIQSGLVNTMTWDAPNKAWKAATSASTYIDTAWKPGPGGKTACMWKKWHDSGSLAGAYGLEGYQSAGKYFYFGSYAATWYLYSGNAGGNATNQGTSPSGPALSQWVFYCLASSGSGGNTRYYAAVPGDASPVLRHLQASNGSDSGHLGDSIGMRYGVLSTGAHPSGAYYGSMIHWDSQLDAAAIDQVFQTTRVYYPGHGGVR
jgi:hypothetical protein